MTEEMEIKDVAKMLAEKVPELVKPCWWPVLGEVADLKRPAILATKFGGTSPWTPSGKKFNWPICDECSEPKTFFCQINMADIPAEMKEQLNRSSGLYQLFFCQACSPFDGVFEDMWFIEEEELGTGTLKHKAAASVAGTNQAYDCLPTVLKEYVDFLKGKEEAKGKGKKGKKSKKAKLAEEEEFDLENKPFEEKLVIEWRKSSLREIPQIFDMEHRVEDVREKLGGISKDDFYEIETDDLFIESEDEEEGAKKSKKKKKAKRSHPDDLTICRNGCKIGGFINFVQDPRYPTCPDCDEEMRIVFLQMAQDGKNLDYIWGDCGTAHVTLCAKCGKPGLGWACG